MTNIFKIKHYPKHNYCGEKNHQLKPLKSRFFTPKLDIVKYDNE
jgi:hypothetical protein